MNDSETIRKTCRAWQSVRSSQLTEQYAAKLHPYATEASQNAVLMFRTKLGGAQLLGMLGEARHTLFPYSGDGGQSEACEQGRVQKR
jgi:hypothetical protein